MSKFGALIQYGTLIERDLITRVVQGLGTWKDSKN